MSRDLSRIWIIVGPMRSLLTSGLMLRSVGALASLVIWTMLPALAEEPCKFFSEAASNELAKNLEQAKSCSAAAARLHDCAWGSSTDKGFASIVIEKCEKTFRGTLPPTGQQRYQEEKKLCAYEFARQEGTMYVSAAALCVVDVAVRFAANPEKANQPGPSASFDCGKARTPLEIAICSDANLGRADIVLSKVYSERLKYSNRQEKLVLVENEKQWLQQVPQKCGLSAKPFSDRSLGCVRNEFELRFTALDACGADLTECLQGEATDDGK